MSPHKEMKTYIERHIDRQEREREREREKYIPEVQVLIRITRYSRIGSHQRENLSFEFDLHTIEERKKCRNVDRIGK